MTAAPDERGIVLNTKTISTLMGMAGLFGLFWQGIGWAKALEAADVKLGYRIETIEVWKDERDKAREKLYAKIDTLVDKVNEQNIKMTEATVAVKALEAQIKSRSR